MDRPQRGVLAGSAWSISLPVHLLAAAARLGRAGGVADDLAHLSGRVESEGATGLERSLPRRQLRFREKRGVAVGKTKRGKGTKWMVVVDGKGLPLGKHLASASPAEVTLAETTLASIRVPNRHGRGQPRQKPQRLIADKAYDSDPLRMRLKKRGIELIVPHKANRVRKPTQDGRSLRRYRKRWKIERTNAWLGNFRRLVV
jgi:transposase